MKIPHWFLIPLQILPGKGGGILLIINVLVAAMLLISCTRVIEPHCSIPIPSHNGTNGFTCTGLCFNETDSTFLIGNIGILSPSAKQFKSTIEIVDRDFNTILKTIPLYKVLPNIRDIQGITINSQDSTIWICSCIENKIHQINKSGQLMKSLEFDSPSGIAYNKGDNTFFIINRKGLYIITPNGEVISFKSLNLPGQDQLYFDNSSNKLYLTYGNNYTKPNYLCIISPSKLKIESKYTLNGSYAVEGISRIDSIIYILNDGAYHSAKIPNNIAVTYSIDQFE